MKGSNYSAAVRLLPGLVTAQFVTPRGLVQTRNHPIKIALSRASLIQRDDA
jgi:hypothetical protein